MCGIFGIYNYGERFTHWRCLKVQEVIANLFRESEVRGDAASGIAVLTEHELDVFKKNVAGSALVNEMGYKGATSNIKFNTLFKAAIGHTRFPTKGSPKDNNNNHPIVTSRVVGVHNGSITNDDDVFESFAINNRKGMVDSEVIFRLIELYLMSNYPIYEATKRSFKFIKGDCTISFIDSKNPNYLVVARGYHSPEVSLWHFAESKMGVFASEENFISNSYVMSSGIEKACISDKWRVKAGYGIRIDLTTGKIFDFVLDFPYETSDSVDLWRR